MHKIRSLFIAALNNDKKYVLYFEMNIYTVAT